MTELTPETTPQAEKEKKHIACHVSDKCDDDQHESVQKNVCRDLETTEHTDGKHYCLLHLPTKEKLDDKGESRVAEFEQLFKARLHEHDEAIAQIEAKFPNDKNSQQEEFREQNIDYDFRYVWFPSYVKLNKHNFKADADFFSATFSADADFSKANFSAETDFISATFKTYAYFNETTFSANTYFDSVTFSFLAYFNEATFSANTYFSSATFSVLADFNLVTFSTSADFSSATFKASAYFSKAAFSADAYFIKATFSADAYFIKATFSADADFNSATFSDSANFSSATFLADVNFSSAKFLETSQIYFENTKFCSVVNFYQTEFDGYVEFIGQVFLSADEVQKVKAKLKNENIKDGQKAFLYLGKARLNKPERISFNSMKLRPSWFVGTDVRKLNFNDVEWLNLEIDVDRSGLNAESNNLTKRGVKLEKESLIKAFNQLADNAEANRRFEEAKQFRKQSIALENKECYICDDVNPNTRSYFRKFVCGDYPVVNEYEGRYYCLWHNPDKNKAEVFLKEFAKRQKNKHQDYYGVVFPTSIMFQDELPKELDFRKAKFQSLVAFVNAKIHKIYFTKAEFTSNSELKFENSFCDEKIILDDATFDGKLFLNGMKHHNFFTKPDNPNLQDGKQLRQIGKVDALDKGLSLKDTRFSKPNQINFRNVRLRPHYFVDVDASKFIFHDCDWKDQNGNEPNIEKEIKCCSHKSLTQACNPIAVNYEESRSFDESTYFRYTAMEAKRLNYVGWRKYLNLYSIYKLTSGYGERWGQAAIVLFCILALSSLLFWSSCSTFDYGERKIERSNDAIEQAIFGVASNGERFRSMGIGEGIVHSFSVATFQRPEPKPADTQTKLFIVLEVILAPLQAALLALAIRRKFMR